MIDITTRQLIQNELARRGVLSWMVKPHQLIIYDHISTCKRVKTVLNVSRQTGKTHVSMIYGVEQCLQRPGLSVAVITGTKEQMRTILLPIMRTITEQLPDDIRPDNKKSESTWEFKNGSRIRLEGADGLALDRNRGRALHLVIIDEAGFVVELERLIKSVILPSFITTNGRVIVISTPPEQPEHYFKTLCVEAAADGSYLEMDVYKNGFATPEKIEEWKKEAGGEDSATWQREYLVQFVIDSKRAVIPEFMAHRDAIIKTALGPAFNYPLVGFDVGTKDATAGVFGYWDFERAKLIIQDELWLRGEDVRTDVIAAEVQRMEKELWQDKDVRFRVVDVDLRLIQDLSSIYGIVFRPVGKDSLEAMVSTVRELVHDEKIEIDPKCSRLIKSLGSAIWTKRRDTWERDADGHHDLLAALIYLARQLPSVRHIDPRPVRIADRASQVMLARQQRPGLAGQLGKLRMM